MNIQLFLQENSTEPSSQTSPRCPARPTQTPFGRTAGPLLGSATVPVAVFGAVPKTISQTEWFNVLPHPGLPQGEGETRAGFLKNPRLDWPDGRQINRKHDR